VQQAYQNGRCHDKVSRCHLHFFEKAFEIKDPVLITIKTWPNVPDTLKNDPRCKELIKRIGFPE